MNAQITELVKTTKGLAAFIAKNGATKEQDQALSNSTDQLINAIKDECRKNDDWDMYYLYQLGVDYFIEKYGIAV